jgi:hypothetical protein
MEEDELKAARWLREETTGGKEFERNRDFASVET